MKTLLPFLIILLCIQSKACLNEYGLIIDKDGRVKENTYVPAEFLLMPFRQNKLEAIVSKSKKY